MLESGKIVIPVRPGALLLPLLLGLSRFKQYLLLLLLPALRCIDPMMLHAAIASCLADSPCEASATEFSLALETLLLWH